MRVKSPVLLITILCLISSIGRFVIDSYLPSLPGIQHGLGLTNLATQMTLTLYLLGFGFSQLIYGPLSDYFGRRKIILSGITIFLLADIGCGFAHSGFTLLLCRLLAGMGAGACGVLNRAIASDCFKGVEFSKVWSYTTTALVITLILAPLIGGYVQELINWRANFFISASFVGMVFAIILWALPETNKTLKQHPLSIKKTLQDYRNIVSSYPFMVSTLCYAFAFAGLIAYFQVSPLLFINRFGLSPAFYGWLSLVIALSYFAGGWIVKKCVHRLGTEKLLHGGIWVLTTGGIIMLTLSSITKVSWVSVLVPAAIYVIGARMVIPNASAQAFHAVGAGGGSISAVIGAIQMLISMLVSLAIAHYSVSTAIPLSWFLIAMGGFSLILFYSQGRVYHLVMKIMMKKFIDVRSIIVIATIIFMQSISKTKLFLLVKKIRVFTYSLRMPKKLQKINLKIRRCLRQHYPIMAVKFKSNA